MTKSCDRTSVRRARLTAVSERVKRGSEKRAVKRRWRDYETPAGRRPVKDFLGTLSDDDAAQVVAAMQDVAEIGKSEARQLDGDIWEVRADGDKVIYRVLFANVGSKGRILLALEAFKKKTQKTPPQTIALAKKRLRDWNSRGELRKS